MTEFLSSRSTDLDEHLVAKAALDAAEEQLKSLCATHAATFVAVERRGAALAAALAELQTAVKRVEPHVSNVQSCLEDGNSLASLSEKHRVRRRTLLQHSSLLELLELPSLMDACVRSNLYEEALSIASFANALQRRHTEKNSVVVRVIAQIRARQSDLRRHLLFRLKQNVTMPQCLEVVTALRRLNSIDLEKVMEGVERAHDAMELKLQVEFLEARDAWLDSSPRSATSSVAPTEQFLDTIERYRTRVFEIASQFNAIFRATPGKDNSSSSSLLSMWTTRRIHSFLSVLGANLSRVQDAAALRDALEACVFFATSMGRLGGDFTPQLAPMFEPKMTSLVTNQWRDGVNQFQDTLTVCRDAGVASPLLSLTATATAIGTTPDQPPRQLLAHPPLARLVNSYLTGLNELRRCLLPGIFGSLRKELKKSLSSVKTVLDMNHRAVNAPGLRGEATELREVASQMMTTWDQLADPYLQGALEVALGNFEVAKELFDKSKQFNEEETKEDESQDKKEDPNEIQGAENNEVSPITETDSGTPVEPSLTSADDDAKGEIIDEQVEGEWNNEDDSEIYA